MRKPNRLKGYDYSQNGVYFITICISNHKKLLWNSMSKNNYQLSKFGDIVDKIINCIPDVYNNTVVLDKYVIMPNHIHIIIILNGNCGRPMVAPTVSKIVQQLKGAVSKEIGFPIFQKSFHDHIIRNKNDYEKIWQYIDENPVKWENDCFYIAP